MDNELVERIRNIDVRYLYGFSVVLMILSVVSFITLPDGKYCSITYKDGSVLTAPRSYCETIHTNANEYVHLNSTTLMDALEQGKEFTTCMDPIEIECPVCPNTDIPETLKKPPVMLKPDLSSEGAVQGFGILSQRPGGAETHTPCPTCPECVECVVPNFECPEPECITMNGDVTQKLSNARPRHSSNAYSGGWFDMKRLCLETIGIKPTKFSEAPSKDMYQLAYGEPKPFTMICFEDTSNGDKNSFMLDRTVWMIPKGAHVEVYKE